MRPAPHLARADTATPVKARPEIDLVPRKRKTRRHDTNDPVRLSVQRNRCADDRWIAAELSLPCCMTQHDGERSRIPGLGILQRSPELGAHAKRREEVARDIRRPELARVS